MQDYHSSCERFNNELESGVWVAMSQDVVRAKDISDKMR